MAFPHGIMQGGLPPVGLAVDGEEEGGCLAGRRGRRGRCLSLSFSSSTSSSFLRDRVVKEEGEEGAVPILSREVERPMPQVIHHPARRGGGGGGGGGEREEERMCLL